ncbi:YceD family protein [Halioxenophilus aromaticivorans]|uniref:Large ribosomal RNA subunit accumulation protein YceD n=1 Tax=Halioxenophilus aromaticivorans TaxID=1306992 RepID=A0AAV3U9V2_9ALTE
MTQAPDSRVLPQYLDARKMANQGCDLGGIVPLNKLERLNSALVRDDGVVNVDLSFTTDERAHRVVDGQISATVYVQCQRCLGELEQSVHSDVHLALVAGEAQAQALPKDLDPWTVVDASADLYHLIEEEILLALPMVAYHQTQCVEPELYSSKHEGSEQEEPVRNPFSVLEQLKGSPE